MLGIIQNITNNVVQNGKYTILFIDKWDSKLAFSIPNYDAVVIRVQKKELQYNIIKQIRINSNLNIYLKPLFIEEDKKQTFLIHTDGIYDSIISLKTIEQILTKTNLLHEIKNIYGDEFILNKIIQFMYSRDAKLNPIKNRFSKIGYSYPFIDLFFKEDSLESLNLLEKIQNQHLIEFKLKDKIQLCNSCHDSYLNYKETCPKCHSIEIQSFDVIHHFPCAHVAPESEFKKEDSDILECPKCNKFLRHIGIDYDKPSSVYKCKNCNTNFQDSNILAECHSNNHINELQELIEIPINNIQLTTKGVLFAETKHKNINNNNENDYSDLFNQLIELESKRTKVSGKSNYLLIINFESKLFTILGTNFSHRFWKDINDFALQYIDSNLYKYSKDNLLKLLFVDKTEQDFIELNHKIISNLQIILEDNLGTNIKINSEYIKLN